MRTGGRPPIGDGLPQTLRIRVSNDMAEYVAANGGSGYVRALIESMMCGTLPEKKPPVVVNVPQNPVVPQNVAAPASVAPDRLVGSSPGPVTLTSPLDQRKAAADAVMERFKPKDFQGGGLRLSDLSRKPSGGRNAQAEEFPEDYGDAPFGED